MFLLANLILRRFLCLKQVLIYKKKARKVYQITFFLNHEIKTLKDFFQIRFNFILLILFNY